MSAPTVPSLTTEDVERLIEAIDSHIYWQLSDDQYRNDGYVDDPGADDQDTAAQIQAYRSLAERLETWRQETGQ